MQKFNDETVSIEILEKKMKKIFAFVVLLISVGLLHAQAPETTDTILQKAFNGQIVIMINFQLLF